jgi:threonine synthase
MKYKSTRGSVNNISFKEAVMMGLAEDGGLIIPEFIPLLTTKDLSEMENMDYQSLAFDVMSRFIDDIDDTSLKILIEKSYSTFNDEDIVPVVNFGNIHIAELFHGPTLAFKDIALQFLGNLFEYILKEQNENMNIIGATSGDTGSAAIHGVKGKDNINICILHPEGKVSKVQEMQMTTVDDPNVFNIAIKGNFDDCQNIVKTIFADVELKKELKLGAVNSINWARILAQVVYYFWTYFRAKTNEKNVNIVVPTGNFGNIFAGIIAKRMGLPINRLILATNENNILSRFVNEGDYSLKEVVQTHSPSMDIQIASNFERYLYYLFNEDSNKINELMKELKDKRKITFDSEIISKVKEEISTYSTSNEETVETISKFFNDFSYILDPHTACGVNATLNDDFFENEEFICLATAHPAKFGDVVIKAINMEIEYPESIKELFNKTKRMYKMPNSTEEVIKFLKENLA